MADYTATGKSPLYRLDSKLPRLLLSTLLIFSLIEVFSLRGLSARGAQEAANLKRSHVNRLIKSHDPYLLLHAHNPVDWFPWGDEALEKARRENKPIFLSIGYSTCYWCHVAERELYSDPGIAELMNKWFVNIKVDREERPDLDAMYMLAAELMTGHGGWPNNLFLTPKLRPFYAGSYFPPRDKAERPGFITILTGLHEAWIKRRADVNAAAARVYERLGQMESETHSLGGAAPDTAAWLDKAIAESEQEFDGVEGGFFGGMGTKFPKAPLLMMHLAAYRDKKHKKSLQMVVHSLSAMARGGLMDQLGGGFHRYSTETTWSIPHFEKMLYNNAELLGLYAEAYGITKNPFFRETALRTAEYLQNKMEAPGGGFYTAQDAEVEGVEGASYLWTREQIESILGKVKAERFFSLYTLVPMPSPRPGHKEASGEVLRIKPAGADAADNPAALAELVRALAPMRKKLLARRDLRLQPSRDEKIVTADNALVIMGFSRAGDVLGDSALGVTALRTAEWLWSESFDKKTGELRHQVFHGHLGGAGFLDDYALLGSAFMRLYHSTGEARWLRRARSVTDSMLKRFTSAGGALTASRRSSGLLFTPPAAGDSIRPGGHSAAIDLLLDLFVSTDKVSYGTAALRALTPLQGRINDRPSEWGYLLSSLSKEGSRAALMKVRARGVVASSAHSVKESHNGSAGHIHASAHWDTSSKGDELVIIMKIDDGYHVNANPASAPYLVPTELIIKDHGEVRVEYPPAKTLKAGFAPEGIAVYSGTVRVRASLSKGASANAPELSLRVQACTDELCLAPAVVDVPLNAAGVQ